MKRIHLTRRTLIIALVIVLALGGGALAYVQLRDPERETDTAQEENINYGPPTEEERRSGDEQKKKIVEQEQTEPATEASVVIADAGQYGDQIETRAFVTNVIEAGTCTFTFTKGSASVQRQTKAFEDASTTQCEAVAIPRSEFPSAGAWTVTVHYQSSVSGEATQTVEVK